MKWDIPEIIEKIVHVLETVYESFKVMLIAFAKSIGIRGGLKDSESSSSVFNRISNMNLPNVVFASFVVVFLLAVFSNGVAVTSIQHDQGQSSSVHPQVKDIPPGNILCSNCNGTGFIVESYTELVNKTCDHSYQTTGLNFVAMGYAVDQGTGSSEIPTMNEDDSTKDTDKSVCPICHGLGWYMESTTKYRDVTCPVCGGKGYVPK
jgi:hypothetical protein